MIIQPTLPLAKVLVIFVWDLRAACGRARFGAGEELGSQLTLSVLGNPVSDAATV